MVSLVVLISVFLLASCGASPSAPTVVPTHHSAATPTPSTQATTTPTPSPGVVLGQQACPSGVADPAYWLPIIKPYSYGGQLTVERVSCASMMGTSSLQTLVTARQADQALDVYAFTNITRPSPTLIFQ